VNLGGLKYKIECVNLGGSSCWLVGLSVGLENDIAAAMLFPGVWLRGFFCV
jgi:hypothetical protein